MAKVSANHLVDVLGNLETRQNRAYPEATFQLPGSDTLIVPSLYRPWRHMLEGFIVIPMSNLAGFDTVQRYLGTF